MKDVNKIKNDIELEKVEGGYPSGTWIPVDSNCPAFGKVTACPYQNKRNHLDECPDCEFSDFEK